MGKCPEEKVHIAKILSNQPALFGLTVSIKTPLIEK